MTMSKPIDLSWDGLALFTGTPGFDEHRPQPAVTDLVDDLPVSEQKHQSAKSSATPAAITSTASSASGGEDQSATPKTMPGIITSIPPSTSEGNEQSGTPSTMSAPFPSRYPIRRDGAHPSDIHATSSVPLNLLSQVVGAPSVVMPAPKTTIEIDGLKYALVDTAAAKNTDDVDSDADGKRTSTVFSSGVVLNDVEVKAAPDDQPTEKGSFNVTLPYDEALAFLNCDQNTADELVVSLFESKIHIYPTTGEFARQAVKSIAEARNSKALLNWLDTGILEDPENSIPWDERLPKIDLPFVWRLSEGELSYPPRSIGQETNTNTYLCSQPFSVIVGTPGVTYYVHKNVLAISPLLERMCETGKAKETGSIALPDENVNIFEHLLGYLYFQKFEPPTATAEWGSAKPNDIIMETYVVAAKYGVDGFRPLLLEHLDLDISIDELCRLAAIVYDAAAETSAFSEFFMNNVTNMLKKTVDEYDEKGWRCSPMFHLARWGERGGSFGMYLTCALTNMAFAQQESNKGIYADELCCGCGEVDCQCERNCNGSELAQDTWDDQCNNPGTSGDDGNGNAGIKKTTQESKAIDVSDQILELTEKVNLLVAQLGNKVGPGLEESVARTAPIALRQLAEAQSFPVHHPSSGADQGEVNQIGDSWGDPSPSAINRPWGPPVNNRLTSGGHAVIALRASDSWECTLTFPAGAIITNVVEGCGSNRYLGWYDGRWGEFPARYVDRNIGTNPSAGGW